MDGMRSRMIGAGFLSPGDEGLKDVVDLVKRGNRLALLPSVSDLQSEQDGLLQTARLFSADSWM